MKHLTLMILMLTLSACGAASKAQRNVDEMFKGPELMETIECRWNSMASAGKANQAVVYTEHTYSDGSRKVKCSASNFENFITANCLPTGIQVVYVITGNVRDGIVETAFVGDETVCTKTFY